MQYISSRTQTQLQIGSMRSSLPLHPDHPRFTIVHSKKYMTHGDIYINYKTTRSTVLVCLVFVTTCVNTLYFVNASVQLQQQAVLSHTQPFYAIFYFLRTSCLCLQKGSQVSTLKRLSSYILSEQRVFRF